MAIRRAIVEVAADIAENVGAEPIHEILDHEKKHLEDKVGFKFADLKKRGIEKVENAADKAIDTIWDKSKAIVNWHPRSIWKRQKFRGQRHLPSNIPAIKTHKPNVIEATATHPVIGSAVVPYASEEQKMVDEIQRQVPKISTGGSFRYSRSFIKMPYGRYRRRRYRKRRRGGSRYATKRGVKMAIAKNVGMSPYQEMHRSDGVFIGLTSGSTPQPAYGQTHRQGIAFMKYINVTGAAIGTAALDEILAAKALPGLGDLGELRAEDNYRYHFKNRRYNFMWHNCMNEVVQATFWWLECNDDSTANSDPAALWETAWKNKSAKATAATQTEFYQDMFTFPFDYHEVRGRWTLKKKYKTVFQPGQTKQMFCKGASFRFAEAENQSGENIKHATNWMLVEVKGVPTHQNSSGTQTTNINYTPAALDCIWTEKVHIARSLRTHMLEQHLNQRDSITAAKSLLNEATADIGPQ